MNTDDPVAVDKSAVSPKNNDKAQSDDPIECALRDNIVDRIQAQPFTCVTATTSVREAMKLMVDRQIACVLVEDHDVLVGVFADRDVLDKVCLEYEHVIDEPVTTVMSSAPVSVRQNDSAAKALSVMAVTGYRHVPVVDENCKPVGIVSPQR